MSSSLKTPEPFSFGASDLASQWKLWRRQFEWYLIATRTDPEEDVDEEKQVGMLITLLGSEGLKIYDTFTFPQALAGNAKKIQPVLDKFQAHFEPRRSEVFERFKFLRRHQLPGETLDTWLIELKSLIQSCGYPADAIESVLRDQLVLGVADPLVREKLLYENDLKLAKACDVIRACETFKNQLTIINTPSAAESAHAVRSFDRKPSSRPDYRPSTSRQQPTSTHQTLPSTQPHSDNQQGRCSKCNRYHKKNQCRVGNVRCHGCGVLGHVVSCCPNQNNQHQRQPQQPARQSPPVTTGRVHALEEEHQWIGNTEQGGTAMALPRSVDDDYFVNHMLRSSSGGTEWYQQLSLDGVDISFKLDSGATCNILPREFFLSMPRQRLRPGPVVRNYGAQNGLLKVLGLHTAKIVHRGATVVVDFVVVDEPGQPPILGLPSCQKLNLICRVDALKSIPVTQPPPIVVKYMDVFTGLGKLPVEHDIKLLSGTNRVDPVICAASRLPFRLEDRVNKKLDEMEDAGIITPVHEPTEWASRMMVVGKPDGDVRICLDPSELNKAVQRQHFSVPTIEQLFAKIGKARYFCSLDAASGFYQIPLSTAASYLCTMATPRGRYRYLRLPFGLKSAPEVYLQTMFDLFGDLPGVLIYFDDFLVTGETQEELHANLEKVFLRCRLHNLKLQLKKCRFFLQELPWLGHVIGQGTLRPDPNKVSAILEMPDPDTPADLVRILGMVTYLDKFCRDLAGLTRPLRDLLKADAAWIWEEPQKLAFTTLKNVLASLPVLRLFDPSQDVVVSVDASPIGIGAVLLQKGQPVAYSSTSLTETQKRYFQIEKELLAIQFGLLRFKQYVYGQTVLVETDHKPLVGLLEKPIASCSPRIQRMRLQLQQFDFKLVYKPGKDLFIADTLSRAPSPNLFNDDVTQGCEEQVHAVLDLVIPKASTREKFAAATSADPTLCLVKEILSKGWPDHKSHCPIAAKPFWSVRHALSEVDGLLLYGSRLVVPVSLRPEVMEGIHDGHFGELKCILRAKSAVYWRGCDDQIRNMVAGCVTCQTHRRRNPSPPLRPVPLPSHAFQHVSGDIFTFESVNYLLVVDAYSKWPSCVPLRSLTSSSIIAEVARVFCDFGTPEVFMSDNGSQFDCVEFRAFCDRRNIRAVSSSPTYAQSNGLVERHIQTVKRTILKMFASGKTLWEALAAIRSTPVSNNLPSPSVLLQGRHLRGNLPFLPDRLAPQHVPATFVQAQLQRRQAMASFQHGGRLDVRGSALRVGQRVRVLISGLWLPGTIESVCTVPDSYVVRLTDGRVFRRTRRDINVDNSSSASSTARAVAAGPILPKLVWHPTLTQPIRPEVPLIIPSTTQATEPPLPNPTTGPNRRGRPTKPTPPTPSLKQVIPPEAVDVRPGSTRSGRPYLKS